MNLEMIDELRENVGVPMKLQVTVGNGNPGDERLEMVGTIRELKKGNRILVFEHCDYDKKRMKINDTTLDLRSTVIWGFDRLIPPEEYKKMRDEEEHMIQNMPCPYCGKDVKIVYRNKPVD